MCQGDSYDHSHVFCPLSPTRCLLISVEYTNLQRAFQRILILGSTHATDPILTRLLSGVWLQMLYYLQKTSRLPTLDSAMNLALRGTLVNEDLPKSKTNGEEGVLAGCYSIQLIFQKHPEGLPECVCVVSH